MLKISAVVAGEVKKASELFVCKKSKKLHCENFNFYSVFPLMVLKTLFKMLANSIGSVIDSSFWKNLVWYKGS